MKETKLFRVLELTYFNPAPKQEAAAQRLGISFSTYRRHLTVAVGRFADWLWEQEQRARDADALVGERTSAIVEPAATTSPSARRRLSIVILPFLNLSYEESVDYLVDGIVDGLITDLSSCLPGSFVVSRSTAFTYKNRAVPIRQVGDELGVRYVQRGAF